MRFSLNTLFQRLIEIAQGLLSFELLLRRSFLILYVNTETDPLADAAVILEYGSAPHSVPHVGPITVPNAILRFVDGPCIHRGLPDDLHTATVIGMKRVEPTPTSHLIDGLSRECTPLRHVNDLAIGCSGPNQRR
jgi:hypothetical protein